MIIVGGLGSVLGAIFGAIFMTLVPEILKNTLGLMAAAFPQARIAILSSDLFGSARALKAQIVEIELDPDEPINIQFTSGTTGFPKAVLLTHHNLLNNAWFSAQALGFGPDDRLCIPVPFYHCFGMVLANLLCLSVGACAVIPCEHFDPLAVLQAIDAEHCTAVHGVPTMFVSELEHP